MIDHDGSQVGVVKIEDALKKALEYELDLVEIAPTASPPVCRISDFAKFKYEKEKKLKEAKKKQRFTHIKEVRIRPRIGSHDLDVKLKHVKEFIERKDKVKISIIFYGRENAHRDLGFALAERIIKQTELYSELEQGIKRVGNRIIMMVVPKK